MIDPHPADEPHPEPLRRRALWVPAKGWPEFFTELVIVVVGVLLALGAQQLVDNWNTRRDVTDFRAALDGELTYSLAAYQARARQSGCVQRRLNELDTWQRSWRDGSGEPLARSIERPVAFGANTSVWRSGAAGIAASMPLSERLRYAYVYDALDGYEGWRQREFAVWQGLYAYDGAAQLSPAEVNALRGLIRSARAIDQSIRGNLAPTLESAATLGVRPDRNAVLAASEAAAAGGLCRPLLSQ